MSERFLLFVVLIAGFGVACSESSEAPAGFQSNTNQADDDPRFGDERESEAQISTQGGTVQTSGASLEVPADALSNSATVRVIETDEPAPTGTALSPVFRFEPAGTVFDQPVTVHFSVAGAPQDAVVVWADKTGNNLEYPPTTVNDGVVSAQVTHFSMGWVSTRNGIVIPPDEDREITVAVATLNSNTGQRQWLPGAELTLMSDTPARSVGVTQPWPCPPGYCDPGDTEEARAKFWVAENEPVVIKAEKAGYVPTLTARQWRADTPHDEEHNLVDIFVGTEALYRDIVSSVSLPFDIQQTGVLFVRLHRGDCPPQPVEVLINGAPPATSIHEVGPGQFAIGNRFCASDEGVVVAFDLPPGLATVTTDPPVCRPFSLNSHPIAAGTLTDVQLDCR